MNINISDIGKYIPMFLAILVVFVVVMLFLCIFVMNKDNGKELKTKRAKILEKPVQQGNIEWYVVEFENGERVKLRNLHADKVIIAIGDEGIIDYKGQTIQSFQRK